MSASSGDSHDLESPGSDDKSQSVTTGVNQYNKKNHNSNQVK